jgi:hypothetical protein
VVHESVDSGVHNAKPDAWHKTSLHVCPGCAKHCGMVPPVEKYDGLWGQWGNERRPTRCTGPQHLVLVRENASARGDATKVVPLNPRNAVQRLHHGGTEERAQLGFERLIKVLLKSSFCTLV